MKRHQNKAKIYAQRDHLQLEVGKDNGDLCAGDHQNAIHQQQEAKDIVVLIQPDGRHDEKELHEAGTKGQDASQQANKHRTEIPWLLRDLARDVGGDHRKLQRILLVTKVSTRKYKGHRNAEPEGQDAQHPQKGHGTGRAVWGNENVQKEEHTEA